MRQFFYTLFLLHFFNDGIRTTLIAMLPFVAKDLHLTFTLVGFLGSSQGFLASIFSLPAGFLSGRLGGDRLMLFSLLLYSLGTLGIAASPHVSFLILTFYFTAAGFGMFHTIGYTLVSRISEKTRIGKNLGNFTAVGDMGRLVLPTIAMIAVPFLGWRLTLFFVAIAGIILYGILQAISRQKRAALLQNSPVTNESHREWTAHILFLLKQKKLLLILAAGVIDGLAGNPIYIFLPFLLLQKGVSIAMLGVFTASYFTGSLFGKSMLGRCTDMFGNANVFVIAEIAMAACLLLLTFSQHFFLLLGIAFLLGIFTRGTSPVVTTLFSEITHANHYEKLFGVSETFLGITAAFAPTLMGIIADTLGITFVFYTAAILALLATIPIIILARTEKINPF